MRLAIRVLVFVCMFVLAVLSAPFVGTSMAQCSDIVRSPTYGKPASKFVSGCEIYFFGEYLEPEEGPDGKTGFLIEKTDSAVTLNGRHFYSPYDPPRKYVDSPELRAIQEQTRDQNAIVHAIEEQFRSKVQRDPQTGAYSIDGVVYEPDRPTPFVVELQDRTETVDVKVSLNYMGGLDYFIVFYEGKDLVGMPIFPRPAPPKEERDKKYLDSAYRGLADIRPGYIILIGRGYQSWKPLSEAPALKAALAKIPALAQPRHKDLYGEWIYEMLKIDGYTFDSKIIRDFIGK